jgi:hypothetical protein
MLYVLVLDGPSAQKASPVVATRDPQIVQAVADAIVARLHPKRLVSLIKREPSDFGPLSPSGFNEDKEGV